MIRYTPRFGRKPAPFSALVGVFEDDALLLRLADRCRMIVPAFSSAAGLLDANDLGLVSERALETAAWDM